MANQVMKKDGSYFSVNPASKNMAELNRALLDGEIFELKNQKKKK